MKHHTFSSTNINISPICIGGNVFGYALNQQETQNLLDQAKDIGINFIDTANVYSNGTSETYIGNSISKNSRAYWKIATKVGIQSNESPIGLGKKEKIITACEASLKRLQTDYIDIYQIHNFDPSTPLHETLTAFDQLLSQGKIKAFGISNYTTNEIESLAQELKSFAHLPCASLQIPFNILRKEAQTNIIPAAIKNKIDILPYNVLARGVLSGKYEQGAPLPENSRASRSENVRSSLTPELFQIINTLKQLAEKKDATLSQLIIAWTLHQTGIISIPLGIRTHSQLIENSKAASLKLSQTELTEIENTLGSQNNYQNLSLVSPNGLRE